MKQNTKLESAIDRRNFYQGRMMENLVNIIFFTKAAGKAKVDTQERIDAKQAIQKSNDNIEYDELMIESFDELIKDLKKDEK